MPLIYVQVWCNYKQMIPTSGAIILNEDLTQVLLCRGWKSGSSWGFPKGKMNEEEPMDLCAIREVEEETGFDITPYMDSEHRIRKQIGSQSNTLFIIPHVPINTKFKPQVRLL